MNKLIKNELELYGLENSEYCILSEKDGIAVVRVYEEKCVLKLFLNKYKREIEIYKLFNRYGIKTIKVLDYQKNSILLEDIKFSDHYRLATKDDMSNPLVLEALRNWYKTLHINGKNIVFENDINFFSEVRELTEEVIDIIHLKSNYDHQYFWNELKGTLPILKFYVDLNQTLTYNDFNYTNMIVAYDYSEAFMFDYNLTGVGLSYFDLRNICSNPYFNEELEEDFKSKFNFKEFDVRIDNILGHLYTLSVAYQRNTFPNWATESLEYLINGSMAIELGNIKKVIEKAHHEIFIDITDNKLRIRNAVVDDIFALIKWWETPSVMEHAGFPNGIKTDYNLLREKTIVRNLTKKTARLIIEFDGNLIGEMSFSEVMPFVYQIGIKICENSYQNKGIGTTALKLLIDCIFKEYGARKIILDTMFENVRAQKVYEKIGFVKVKINEDVWQDQLGNRRTSIDYELVRDNFIK